MVLSIGNGNTSISGINLPYQYFMISHLDRDLTKSSNDLYFMTLCQTKNPNENKKLMLNHATQSLIGGGEVLKLDYTRLCT